MTQEQKAKAYDEALAKCKAYIEDTTKRWSEEFCKATETVFEEIFPELAESEDERIRKALIDGVRQIRCKNGITQEQMIAYLEKQKENTWSEEDDAKVKVMCEEGDLKPSERAWLKDLKNRVWKEQKSIKIEVYEVGKGTTICGQDYKCKKDYKEGNCWYIKDAIYHCGRDGYLTDQNGVSWSCTPEWFNEYIQSNTEWAEEEKTHFVNGQFLQCKLSFEGFKEGEYYWLEYVGDDMYVGRSDNILNQKFHITPRQLFTLFSQQLEEVQGPPQEEKQVPLNYEPPFNENPSDREIIEALIKHLKEQDGILTAIDCISTKAILSWLEKQKVPNSEWSEEDEKIRNAILGFLNPDKGGTKYSSNAELVWWSNWLKSIRPVSKESLQPHWKPSEEQMEAFKGYIEDFQAKAEAAVGGWNNFDVMIRLYEQLKKLM